MAKYQVLRSTSPVGLGCTLRPVLPPVYFPWGSPFSGGVRFISGLWGRRGRGGGQLLRKGLERKKRLEYGNLEGPGKALGRGSFTGEQVGRGSCVFHN